MLRKTSTKDTNMANHNEAQVDNRHEVVYDDIIDQDRRAIEDNNVTEERGHPAHVNSVMIMAPENQN